MRVTWTEWMNKWGNETAFLIEGGDRENLEVYWRKLANDRVSFTDYLSLWNRLEFSGLTYLPSWKGKPRVALISGLTHSEFSLNLLCEMGPWTLQQSSDLKVTAAGLKFAGLVQNQSVTQSFVCAAVSSQVYLGLRHEQHSDLHLRSVPQHCSHRSTQSLCNRCFSFIAYMLLLILSS